MEASYQSNSTTDNATVPKLATQSKYMTFSGFWSGYHPEDTPSPQANQTTF